MTKAEWDAMDPVKKDGLILTTFWKAENGKPIDIKWTTDTEDGEVLYGEYIRSGKPWRTHEIEAVHVPRFTVDRNACALVLDEIERRGLMDDLVYGTPADPWTGPWLCEDGIDVGAALRADPDTICYAALKALE